MKRILFPAAFFALTCLAASAERPEGGDQFQAAADRYHQLLADKPRKGTAFDLLYRHYLDAGKLDELVAHYEQLVKKEPKSAAAHMTLGLVYERRGRVEEAFNAFDTASKLTSDDFYPEYAAAMLLARQHRHEEAIKAFERALANKPEPTQMLQIYKRLGRLHLRQGDREAALGVWSKMAETFPDDRFAIKELAELLAEEEQFDEAIERYEQLAELSRQDLYNQLMSRVEIGQIQVRQGKLQTAIQTFESCLDQVRPDSWLAEDIRRRIEEIFVRGDDLSGLAEYYKQRLSGRPDDLAAMIRLGQTLAKLGQSDAAIEQYRTALDLAPSRTDVREKLIDELTRRDDFAAAIDQTRTLLEKDPENTEHLQRLGDLYLRSAGLDRAAAEAKALDAWQRIAGARPDDPLAAMRVAELCRAAAGIGSRWTGAADPDRTRQQAETTLGKAALEHYAEAARRAPGVPQYHEYLGEYLHAIGRVEEALAAWRRLAEPPNDSVENLKRLAQIFAGVGRLEEAVEAVEQAIAKESDRYDLHELAADLLIRRHEWDAALESVAAMERVADTPYLEEHALKKRVETYAAAGRLAEEAEKLSESLKAGEAGVRDWWLAAMLAAAERRSTAALAHLEQALKMKPGDTRLLRFKAGVHQQGGDLAGAAEQYRRLAGLEPGNRIAHLKEVVALELELGRIQSAAEVAQRIVRLAPDSAEAAQLLADVHFRGGDAEKGLEALRGALRGDPRNTEIRLVLARRLIERQEVDEAIEHLWRTFELTEDQQGKLAVVGDLADQYTVAGRHPELVERLERLRRAQEDTLGTTLYLVEAYTRAEDFANARRELNALLARRPDDAQVLSQLVALSERLGDAETAIDYQQKVVELAPSAETLGRLAQLYTDAGKTEQAGQIWLRLAREAKDDEAILSAIDRALRNRDYDQSVALAEPEWARRPDDWRVGCRLAWAYWLSQHRERAKGVCEAMLALLPSTAYEKEQAATIAQQQARLSPYQQYPAVLMRISAPTEIRSTLAGSGSRGFGSGGWQPRELLDAQMFCSLMLHEAARAEGKQESLVEGLRRRSQTDLNAVRQLVWIYLSERKVDELGPLLEKWLAESPSDAEPRVTMFVLPMILRGGPGDLPAAEEHLEEMNVQYGWFSQNRPDLARFLAMVYVQLLMTAGRKDEAVEHVRAAIAGAQNLTELSQLGFLVMQLEDTELLSSLLARVEALKGSLSGTLPGWGYYQRLVRNCVEAAARQKNWDGLLESFDRYMTVTHPKAIRPMGLRAMSIASSFSPRAPSARRSDRTGTFPRPSAWLDEGRVEMLQSAHRALRSAGLGERLIQLVERRAAESQGVPGQCWTLCRIFLFWLEDDRQEAIGRLEEFLGQTPGNVEICMLLARGHAEMGENEKALAAIEDAHLPFGPLAKALEQMRMELALRADNEEVGKRAALRLFGMRLTSSEQAELAKVMRGYGLAARSEELLDRAVRTAGNRPSELAQLMRESSTTNLTRAAEIARTILRQARRSSRADDANNRYRHEALQVLKRVGELQRLIEQAEQQLAAAPKSVKLMEDLVEYHTANGDEVKAGEMIDRLLAVRPDDANLHFRVAQSLFTRNRYAEGVERLAVVWEKEPELALRQGYELGRHYARARKLDRLAEHLVKLKDHPSLAQQGYHVVNMVQNLRHNTSDVDGLIKVYRAAVDVMPPERRGHAVQEFGQFLVEKRRKDDAYALYKEFLLPKPDEEEASPAERGPTGLHYVNGALATVPVQLANLARDLGKSDELAEEIEGATAKHPGWKPLGELLAAMLKRRAGNEAPLEKIGKRFLEDDEYARSLGRHFHTLRDELEHCGTESALRTALGIWQKGQPRAPGAAVYYGGSPSDQIRIAAIHMKLKEPEGARQVLLEALEAKPPGVFSARDLVEQTIQRQLSIADALRGHGFHLDAAAVYCEALQRVPEVDRDSYVRRGQAPRARRSLRESVVQLIGQRREETLEELIAELKKDRPGLARFFAVCDPASPDETARYGFPSTTDTSAKAVASAKAQLLPAILLHARTADRLPEIEKLIEGQSGNSGEDESEARDRLAALAILATASGNNPEQAVRPLTEWLERIRSKESLADRPETWLLALAALEHEPTSEPGRLLAVAVARSAARRGDSARQEAAMAALAASGKDADALIGQMLADRKGDPQTYYQIAQAYYRRKQYAKAVEALEVVWERAPDMIMPQLRQLADYYIKANKLDALAEAVRSVRDPDLQDRYGYEVGNLFYQLPKQPQYAQDVVKLYFVGVEFAPQHSASYDSRLASYLRGLPHDEKTLDVYRSVVFPSARHEGRLGDLAGPFVDLAQSTKQAAAVKGDCRRAMTEHPQWKAKGELLLAMLEQRLGDEKPLVQFAEKYRGDQSLAAELTSEVDLLRRELPRCDGRPAVELAIELWRPQMASEQGGSTSATTQVARLLAKLGDREAARQTLLQRLRKPFSITYNASEDNLVQMKVQEKQALGQELARQGFKLEALEAYASALAVDTSKVRNRSYAGSLLRRAQDAARKLIAELVSADAETTLSQLRAALGQKEPGRGLAPLLVVLDAPPAGATEPVPTPGGPDSVLVPALEQAKDRGLLPHLREAVTKARQQDAQDYRLLALGALTALASGETDAAAADLERLRERVRQSPKLADDAVWLAAREAMKADATRPMGHALAEAVAGHARAAGNLPRQEAALLALADSLSAMGQSERAAELMRELTVGKSGGPETQLQLARVYFRRNRGAEAVQTLAPLWKTQPDLLLANIGELVMLCADAGVIHTLSEALKGVEDEDLRNRYNHEVVRAARSLGNDKSRAEAAIKMLRAATEFAPSNNREYAMQNLAGYLSSQGRKEEAWKVYCEAVIPPTGPADRLAAQAVAFAGLTDELDKLDDLVRASEQAAKTHPAWQSCADLLLAMTRLRKDQDKGPLVRVAERYLADAGYAEPLRRSASVVRGQLDKLSAKPALEVAAELWESEINRLRSAEYSGSTEYQAYGSFADVLIKLGRSEKAREILLEAVEAPMPSYSADYLQYHLFQRRERLAPKLLEAGCPLDALKLLVENVALEGTDVAERHGLSGRIAAGRRGVRKAVLGTLAGHLDEALDALEEALAASPPQLEVLFAVAAPPWTEAEAAQIPERVRAKPSVQTQLLPAVLRHARSKDRTEAIAKALAAARSSDPKNGLLAVLETFLEQARGAGDPVPALVGLSKHPDRNVQALAIAGLAEFPAKEAAAAIIAAATDNDRKLLAVGALEGQDSPEAARALGRWLASTDGDLRMRAEAALLRMNTPEAGELLRYERVARDEFDGSPSLDWHIENPAPQSVSYEKRPGMLTIRAHNGGFVRNSATYQNVFLIENPVSGADFRITACVVGFVPKEPHQQAVLLVWNDDDNYLKLSYECGTNPKAPRLTVIPENGGSVPTRADVRLTEQTDRLWLRLARLGNHYVYASSTDGKRFVRHGLMAWGGGEPRFVGLAAIAPGDPAPPEVDVSFDFFDVQRPVGSAVVRPMDLPIVEVTEAIKRKPEDAELWFRRADLYARRGRWQEAADDLAKGLDLAPENHWHWYRSACLQLQIGNQEEYDRHCREMLRRFGETRTAHIAERVAKICLLSPDPVDTDLPARLAERAVASGPSSNIYHWFLLAKGIAEYRTGQFEQAVRRLEECRDLAPKTQTYCLAADHLFLAMANHQLGKGARARRDYEAANRIMARFPKAGGLTEIGGWNDWIIAHLARKEAEALLKAGPRQPPRDGASRPE